MDVSEQQLGPPQGVRSTQTSYESQQHNWYTPCESAAQASLERLFVQQDGGRPCMEERLEIVKTCFAFNSKLK